MVLAALSDYRVSFEESFRFEELLSFLRLPENEEDSTDVQPRDLVSENGGWEPRTAVLTLINAITNCPDSLEERIQLREEFSRRGLNEIIVVSKVTCLLCGDCDKHGRRHCDISGLPTPSLPR